MIPCPQFLLMLILLMLSATSGHQSKPAAKSDPVVITNVAGLHSGECSLPYRTYAQEELNSLIASGQLDINHKCHCLPQQYTQIKSDYLKRLRDWKLIVLSIEKPFPIESTHLPKIWSGKQVSSVLVAGYRNTTLVYLGIR